MSKQGELLILSLGRRGGSVRYATSLIDAMGTEPKDVFVSRYSREKPPAGAFAIPTYRNKLEFIFSSVLILPFFWLYVIMGLFKKRYRALYTPYTHYWNTLFVWTFKKFGLKTFSTVHDGIPHLGDGNSWEKMINRYTLKHSEHLVFLSNHVRQFLKSKIGFEAQTSVIPHGFLQIQGVVPIRRTLPQHSTLLFLGRVCEYKGVDLLLDALQYVNRDRINQCVIAGELNQDQKHLKEQAYALPVQWVDKWLSEEEMAHYIQRADILVLPYREATQSGVMTLGISAGLPMVITRVGGLVEQCNENECVWVDAEAQSIAQGIMQYIDSPEKVEQVQDALEDKRRQGSWSNLAMNLLDCIHAK